MDTSSSALSQTVESITLTKIKELVRQRERYEAQKNDVLALADKCQDQRDRITQLLAGVEKLYPEAASETAVSNVQYWLYQAKYDTSVPRKLLQEHEELLRSKLEVRSRKLALGHLYARLVTEWMAGPGSNDAEASTEEESFEVLDRQKQRLQELCDKFEGVVFTPFETDEVEIDNFLRSMFEGDEGHEKSLMQLRRDITYDSKNLFINTAPFDEFTLKWCINGLLAEDLLSDEKQAMLKEFLGNSVVLDEMADVLNMRFNDIDNWDWDAPEGGIPVLPRQQLNGKYRIWMDEDVLQAIFIHYVGTKCCVSLKRALTVLLSDKNGVWKWRTGPMPSVDDRNRHLYYLNRDNFAIGGLAADRKTQFLSEFFASSLPSELTDFSSAYGENAQDAKKGSTKGSKSGSTKQSMLRTIASDVIMHRSIKGEVAVVQTDLEWFATALPHSTIFAVMRFFGYPEKMISFYKKFLQAPLTLHSSPDHPPTGGPRIRRRGVPLAHAPEKLLGELILFVMDLAVNQEDGMLLYRLHDDLWLCGEPSHCARGWEAMGRVAELLGLRFNKHKTGSVYFGEKKIDPVVASTLPEGKVQIGHLYLDPKEEKWQIDHVHVNEHVQQLKKQLGQCKSVLQWVQTWNSCIGRFFGHTFGEPAYCFGPDHVDSILECHRQMQKILFSTSEGEGQTAAGVLEHIKGMIRERFEEADIPDAFIYLPEKLGGLGLQNPFVHLLEIRNVLKLHKPASIMATMRESELTQYKDFKKTFDDAGTTEKRLARFNRWSGHSRVEVTSKLTESELDTFMSMDDFTRWRETTSEAAQLAYAQLRETPEPDGPMIDEDTRSTLLYELNLDSNELYGRDRQVRELKWALQLYRDGLNRDFGGARLVDKKYLPLGVLAMMRSQAVKWTMVL